VGAEEVGVASRTVTGATTVVVEGAVTGTLGVAETVIATTVTATEVEVDVDATRRDLARALPTSVEATTVRVAVAAVAHLEAPRTPATEETTTTEAARAPEETREVGQMMIEEKERG